MAVTKEDLNIVWTEMRELRSDLQSTRDTVIAVATKLEDFKPPEQPCQDMKRILRERAAEKEGRIKAKWQVVAQVCARMLVCLGVGLGCVWLLLWRLSARFGF